MSRFSLIFIVHLTLAFFCSPLTQAQDPITYRSSLGLAPVQELAEREGLPDPFEFLDGTRVQTLEDWSRRREEIKQMMLYYEYGFPPAEVPSFGVHLERNQEVHDGLGIEKRFVLAFGPTQSVTMTVRTLRPQGDGPFPVIVNNTRDVGQVPIDREIVKRGFALAEYVRTDLDPDQNDVVGSAQAAYPEADWATLMVWAWGAMRVADYLETQPWADMDRLAVTGHSRGGKTALLAGALDERFDVVNPNGSGCGGAGSFLILGENCETLEAITDPKRFSYWFHPRLREFAGKENRLPFDQHFMKALVAPRALLATDAYGDRWANPLGTQVTYLAAQPVFDFLGAKDKNGIHFREGAHDHSKADWRALLDFMKTSLSGDRPDRNFRRVQVEALKWKTDFKPAD